MPHGGDQVFHTESLGRNIWEEQGGIKIPYKSLVGQVSYRYIADLDVVRGEDNHLSRYLLIQRKKTLNLRRNRVFFGVISVGCPWNALIHPT
jgi:hypothetical protein